MIRVTKREFIFYLGMVLMLFPIFNFSLQYVLMPGSTSHIYPVLAAGMVYLYRNKGGRFQCNPIIGILLILALGFLYIGASLDHNLNDWKLPYLSVFFSALLLHLDDKWWGIFWRVILWYCIFHLITGIILLAIPDFQVNAIVPLLIGDERSKSRLVTFIQRGYMTGLTCHYTYMGIYMVLGLVASSKPLFADQKLVKPKDWILFGSFLVGLILTNKRGPFLFALAAIVFIYWLTNHPFTKKQYIRVFFIIIFTAAATFLLYLALPQFRTLLARFQSDTGDLDEMSNGRIEYYWLSALQMFLQKPLLGHGWRSFRQLNQTMFGFTRANDAHNIYLQLLAETGIVGFAVYVTLFIGAFLLTYKAYSLQKKHSVLTSEQMLSLKLSMVYQIFFLMYGFTENPLYERSCFVPYFLCCTIGYAAWYKISMELKKRALLNQSPLPSKKTHTLRQRTAVSQQAIVQRKDL